MCFELDSLPPVSAVSGAAVDHRDLELESGDGTRFAAFAALPDRPTGGVVLVLPDVRGRMLLIHLLQLLGDDEEAADE